MVDDRGYARAMHEPLLPQLLLNRAALEHNVSTMAEWCRAQNVELAPHIKTTMCRPIVELQSAADAWGVTVATIRQCETAVGWGYRRIILANEVVQPEALRRLRQLLEQTPDLQVLCLVDSPAGVQLAAESFRAAARPLDVLVDVGAAGGRTGVRDVEAGLTLGRQVAGTDRALRLIGVAGYEGVAPNNRSPATIAAVDEHCRRTAELFDELQSVFQTDTPVFTMGGSAFPDRVVLAIRRLAGVVPVLRSGCYVTHDHGTYAGVCPIPGLRPALRVRASVLSAPEPARVVVGAGKRELPYDAGLPVLLAAHAPDGSPRPAATGTAAQLFDHHLVLAPAHGLSVGDSVDLGISHPCSAFDRWREVVVTDDSGATVDVWPTEFG